MTSIAAAPVLRCVFFDFDGTIAETERNGHRVAYNRAFDELGLGWNWDAELYGELLSVAGGVERLKHYVERYSPPLPSGIALDDLVLDIHRTKGRAFAGLVASLEFRRGVRRLIREAHEAHIRVAIVTTASESGVEAFLAADPNVRAMIDLIAAGDIVPRKKPEPDVYEWALRRLDVAASEAVAVEDSNIGLRSALSAGVTTVVTPSDYTSTDDFEGAAVILSDLGEPGAPASPIRGVAPDGGVVTPHYLQSLLAVRSH